MANSVMKSRAGGEGRTRTFEAMRRLIYSQLPLPLGTLPRSTASQPARRNGGDEAMDDAETKAPITGSSVAAFMAESPRQSQPTRPLIRAARGSNCHYPEPVTQAEPMKDRDRKPRFQHGGGKGPDKRRESGRRPAWGGRDPVVTQALFSGC